MLIIFYTSLLIYFHYINFIKYYLKAQLTRQREEFWGTRIDGSRIMWQGIRTAAEALLQDDIDLARAILDVYLL